MSNYNNSIRYCELDQLKNLISKSHKTITRYVSDGKITPIYDENGKIYFDTQEIIKNIGLKPCVDEISFAISGETRIGKTTLKDSILHPESRDIDKEITTNNGDTKITRNYIVRKNNTEYWKINECKFNVFEIQENIISNFKEKQEEDLINEYKNNPEKINIYIDYLVGQQDKDLRSDKNKLYKEIDKIKKEDLSNDCLKKHIYPQVLSQIKELIKINNFLDFKKYEKIINEYDLDDIITDEVLTYDEVLKKLSKELNNDIKKLSKVEFESHDSVNLAKLVKSIDIDVRMNDYISRNTGLQTIKITDTRGIGDSDDILNRGTFINSFDVILILMTPNEGSSKKIKDTIEKMNIVSSNIECVVVDKNFERKLDDSIKKERIQTAEKNYEIIKQIAMDLNLVPKKITEYQDSETLSIAMNLDFGSLIPRYNKDLNNKKDELFYQDHVVKLLNKIAYSKYLSLHVIDNIIDKLCNFKIQPIEYFGYSLEREIYRMSNALNSGTAYNLIMVPQRGAFRRNMFKVFQLDMTRKGVESEWVFQYSGHYLTESGAIVLKNLIVKLIDGYCDNLNSKLSRAEELIFIREFYKYLMQLEVYRMYRFGNDFSYKVRERLSINSYKNSLIKEQGIIDISTFTPEYDFSNETRNVLINMINYSINDFINNLSNT